MSHPASAWATIIPFVLLVIIGILIANHIIRSIIRSRSKLRADRARKVRNAYAKLFKNTNSPLS